MEQISLPKGFHILPTQVAGHLFQENTNAIGLLQLDTAENTVLKPTGKPECEKSELGFYKTLQKWQAEREVCEEKRLIHCLVPKFYKSVTLSVNHKDVNFLQLENLTYGMKKPCIMDIKVGKRTWDPISTPRKRAVEETKYVQTKKVIGLCLPGFQMYKPCHYESLQVDEQLLRHDKEYGKQLNVEGFEATIAMFLNAHSLYYCEELIVEVLKQLQQIQYWFRLQKYFHFYASSLLVAYDYEVLKKYLKTKHNSMELPNETIEDLPKPAQWITVRMIDFAHVFCSEDNSLDTNYLYGLENLIEIVKKLLTTTPSNNCNNSLQ